MREHHSKAIMYGTVTLSLPAQQDGLYSERSSAITDKPPDACARRAVLSGDALGVGDLLGLSGLHLVQKTGMAAWATIW